MLSKKQPTQSQKSRPKSPPKHCSGTLFVTFVFNKLYYWTGVYSNSSTHRRPFYLKFTKYSAKEGTLSTSASSNPSKKYSECLEFLESPTPNTIENELSKLIHSPIPTESIHTCNSRNLKLYNADKNIATKVSTLDVFHCVNSRN